MSRAYKDFDLRIRGDALAGYTVEAAVSGGGSVRPQPLILPDDEAFELRLDGVLHQTTNDENMRVVGEALFNALFPTRVLKLWVSAGGGLGDEVGLRIRLHISPHELASLPWELAFDEEYIGLRLRFPIVRYLDLPDPPKPIAVQPPLRVLVAVSQPKDVRSLDVDVELTNIRQALAQLPAGRVKVEVFDPARRDELLTRLRKGHHVLHYIGHGAFQNSEGYLILEDTERLSDQISASLLGRIVADSTLRLVILNACETSVTGPENAFGGVAQQLMQAGVPAVIAMQQAIADKSALAFSREFYGALADGWPVDTSVQEGRRGIMTALGNCWKELVDWAIPTLYMRTPDGVILEMRQKEEKKTMEDKDRLKSVGGDNIQITIGDRASNVAAGKDVHQVTRTTTFHGSVHGPVHTGGGNIHVSDLRYGMDVEDIHTLFEALRKQVEEDAPPEKKSNALQKVDMLQEAIEEDKPDLGMMESVLSWFKKNIPQLAGAVTSVILNPVVGNIVEAAGDLIAEEFKRRFGG